MYLTAYPVLHKNGVQTNQKKTQTKQKGEEKNKPKLKDISVEIL